MTQRWNSSFTTVLAALALALVSSCGHSPGGPSGPVLKAPPLSANQPSRPTGVQVGDTLEIFVMEDSAFNGNFKVREKGDIILPKLGRVTVVGLTPEAIQERLKSLLQSSQLTSATVIVDRVNTSGLTNFSEAPKILVFVTGSVNRPGQHLIAVERGDTLYAYEAVLIAGGTNSFGDEKKAYILRRSAHGSRQRIPLDLRSIRQGSGVDVALAEGDMICVPTRRFSL